MSPDTARLAADIYEDILHEVGNVVTGDALRRALGFVSIGAMNKAITRKKLPLPFFQMPGRRGKFVLARELASFIARQHGQIDSQNK